MTDLRIEHTADGGDLVFENNDDLAVTDEPFCAVYLSLFGGNERDGGDEADDPLQWWGNLGETRDERRYRSRTQSLLRSLPAVTANLRRIEDAASADLEWMLSTGLATSVLASVTMTARSRILLTIRIEIDGIVYPYEFARNFGP